MAIPITATDVLTILDAYAKELAAAFPALGLGKSGETGTAAAAAIAAKTAILGNDTTFGIGNNDLKSTLTRALDGAIQTLRYDTLFQNLARGIVSVLDTQIKNSLPTGWALTAPGSLHYLDNWLLRANGAHSATPATPAAAGVLTATTTSAGAMPLTSAGSAPRVLHTLVKSNRWDESLPSAEATQVALTGSQNGYTYQIPSNVPSGIYYVNVYRSAFGSAGAPYGYDQTVAVTPGATYPAISVVQADSSLQMKWNPPSWLSCMQRPEAAALVALAYALAGFGGIQEGVPLALLAGNMLTPANVLLGPATGFLGLGNQPQTAWFGSRTIGSSYVQGTLSTANNAPTSVQGYAGAIGLQARVTSALNAAGTIQCTYNYYDSAHGFGSAQSATTTAVAFSGTGAGSLAVPVIPSGRLIIGIPTDNPAGQSSGAYVWEAAPIRP